MNHNLKKKKTQLFGKLYMLYVVLLIVAIVGMFFYVRGIMVTYEKSQPENLVMSMINGAGDTDKALGQYLKENCFGENNPGDGTQRRAYFYKTDAYSSLTLSKNLAKCEDDLLVYDVQADNKPFIEIAIKKVKTVNKLGMLNIDTYELQYAFLRDPNSKKNTVSLDENGKYVFNVTLPEDFKLCFDGKEVDISAGKVGSLEDFKALEGLSQAPECTQLEFTLAFEPAITVYNNGGDEVGYSVNKNSYYANADYAASDVARSKIKSFCDPLEIAKLWAAFMIDEVPGEVNGLYKVIDECLLLKGTDLYHKADSWANSIDITFVTDHEDHWFENEKVENYAKINDNLYSCDVSFTHVIYINQGGYIGNREVEYNTRMFFVKQQGEWYWAGSLDLTAR